MPKQFTVDARTIIHLGRESIKDHTTALLELVKNSYDADANVVEIEIYKRSTQNTIRISDDGDGMTEDDIDEKWLRIGFSHKKSNKESSSKHRRKTGEKGIGRLSADRLGEILEIRTKSDVTEAYGLTVNWEAFNQDNLVLSEIPIDEIEKPVIVTLPEEKKRDTGTELIIRNLRANWTSENIQNLYNELMILTPPFKEVEDFEIYLKNDISAKFNGKVEQTTILSPEVEIELDYNGESFELEYVIKDRFHPDRVVTEKIAWNTLMQKVIDPFDYPFTERLLCGPVKIRLLLYPRTKALAEGTKFTLTELREYIDKNVGVKIYRDNISVKPYGFPNIQYGGDWLGLAERHSRNPAGIDRPEYRVVANQLVGAVFIGRDKNQNLTDSASREGLVENEAFYDLRALTLGALALLENRRYQIYQDNKAQKNVKPTPTETVESFKEKIETIKEEVKSLKNVSPTKLPDPEEFKQTLEHFEDFIKDSEQTSISFEELLNHNRVLAGLATLGISAAVFGHETQGAITEFNQAALLAKEYLEFSPEEIDLITDELSKALKYGSQVAAWGAFSLSRVQREKRQKEVRKIHDIIDSILKELEKVFSAVSIEIQMQLSPVSAKVYPMDIESILINLLTNAYTACLQNQSNRKISVSLALEDIEEKKGFHIILANSGPPIEPNLNDWIWEPLNTLKKDVEGKETGTGLGLTIVKSIVEALKGEKFVYNDNILNGAAFKIWLPLK
jgi:two-component sensor histidine kinase